ncbi:MAG: 16S rRNA (guanine(966)-N(2))-methyltransferase RsmD [endosymbiont of Galathealinum brachiosum]|uniref:Ribosomal RNA small subunit methyltransferase D n=1 Tax=endosymbiont of Galathealinum brachiosum TaxID=2200906 RepID=A0A370DDH3_9GAMM|nr:MAG: 16S rRNA (guanine(966)-N(2))-methyltransferase RsmD [endosymbiont of Galathealinum brachiosum]
MAKQQRKASAGKLRIIGGKWRSRFLQVADLPGLRPTTDRVRETLFNWLQNDVAGAQCLDLFAGSGALGFEAASRGAASVLMLEKQSPAVRILNANVQELNADTVQVLQQDAIGWLNSNPPTIFDIVFIDPPFASDYLAPACQLLEDKQCLSEHACIYLEMDRKDDLPELPQGWNVVREKKAGQVSYYLVRRNYDG